MCDIVSLRRKAKMLVGKFERGKHRVWNDGGSETINNLSPGKCEVSGGVGLI
jgi:hypothetical protein